MSDLELQAQSVAQKVKQIADANNWQLTPELVKALVALIQKQSQ